jgi:hypothetical protein
MTGVTWLAWRQQRWALLGAAGVLAVYGLAAAGEPWWLTWTLARAGDFAQPLFVLSLGFGACWAAPLLAREQQRGTLDLAYTQSISRLWWLVARIAPTLVIATVTTCAVMSLIARWQDPQDVVQLSSLQPGYTLVAVGYVLFTVAVGLCAGAVLGRTIPAMAVTVTAFYAVLIAASRIAEAVLDVPSGYADPDMLRRRVTVGLVGISVVLLGVTVGWMTRRVPRS